MLTVQEIANDLIKCAGDHVIHMVNTAFEVSRGYRAFESVLEADPILSAVVNDVAKAKQPPRRAQRKRISKLFQAKAKSIGKSKKIATKKKRETKLNTSGKDRMYRLRKFVAKGGKITTEQRDFIIAYQKANVCKVVIATDPDNLDSATPNE